MTPLFPPPSTAVNTLLEKFNAYGAQIKTLTHEFKKGETHSSHS